MFVCAIHGGIRIRVDHSDFRMGRGATSGGSREELPRNFLRLAESFHANHMRNIIFYEISRITLQYNLIRLHCTPGASRFRDSINKSYSIWLLDK